VRKEAAIALNDMILAIPKFPEVVLVEAFNAFYLDQQDSVKMQCIDCCVSFSKNMQPARVSSFILPCIKELANVNSWRIRYLVADRIREIARGLSVESTKETLLPHYISFLKDAESEVRTAAVRRMAEFCQILGVQEIVQMIIPCLKDLQND